MRLGAFGRHGPIAGNKVNGLEPSDLKILYERVLTCVVWLYTGAVAEFWCRVVGERGEVEVGGSWAESLVGKMAGDHACPP